MKATRSLFLFSDISGQPSVANNSSSSASGAGPSASASASAGNKSRPQLPSGCHPGYTVDSPVGGDTSLRIDAMMNYEFQPTNSESLHRVSPDECRIPSLSNSTSVTRCIFSDDLRTLLLRVIKRTMLLLLYPSSLSFLDARTGS